MHPSLRRRASNERGAINFVTLFFLLVAGTAAYLGYAYVPHWLRNRDVVSAMREAAYQAWRVRDDGEIRRMIRAKTDRLITVDDGAGRYPVIDDGMIRVDRDGSFIYIDVSYEIPMHLPGTQKIRRISFDNSVKSDLKSPTAE